MISAWYCLTFFQTSADRLSEQYFFYLNTDTKYKTFIHFQSSQMICLSVKHSSSVKVFWYYYFVQINAMSMDSCSKSTNIEVCCPVPCLVGIDSYVTACEVFPNIFFFLFPRPRNGSQREPRMVVDAGKSSSCKAVHNLNLNLKAAVSSGIVSPSVCVCLAGCDNVLCKTFCWTDLVVLGFRKCSFTSLPCHLPEHCSCAG